MGFFSKIINLFRKKRSPEALQSASNNFKALQSDAKALQDRFKALQSASESIEKSEVYEPMKPKDSIELQRDSLQLGIAAGYTGRTLREIESSLHRIESQMTSKEWFLSNFADSLNSIQEIKELLRSHDENINKKLEIIQNSIDSIKKTAEIAPSPIKEEILTEVEKIERQLPLTPRMKEVLAIVKSAGEISYKDLAQRLGWKNTSGLRGLLTNMVKRTDEIERFEKNGQGWVRYKGALQSALNRSEALNHNLE